MAHEPEAVWHVAAPMDDEPIVAMCVALYEEDQGEPVHPEQVRRTLALLRAEPARGRAVVIERDHHVIGYALLISFWSNEYGGEICIVDEMYVTPPHRGRGLGTGLFGAVLRDRALWPTVPAALELEVSPKNHRARALYERLGFKARNQTLRRRVD